MRIFSPTQTTNYRQCPIKWLYDKAGWMPKSYSKADLHAIRGAAVGAALEALFHEHDVEAAIQGTVDAEWEKKKIRQRAWSDFRSDPIRKHEIARQAGVLVEAFAALPSLPFHVLEVEKTFKEHGWARPDLVVELPGGIVAPYDYKVKDVPYTKAIESNIRNDFRHSWQMLHYCWATGSDRFGIILLWYDKKCKVEFLDFAVTQYELDNWLASATATWKEMAEVLDGKRPALFPVEHSTKFGPCPFYSACFQHNGNRDAMATDYIRRERSENSNPAGNLSIIG